MRWMLTTKRPKIAALPLAEAGEGGGYRCILEGTRGNQANINDYVGIIGRWTYMYFKKIISSADRLKDTV